MLVTGGCGAIGNHVVRVLADRLPRGTEVVNLDLLTYAASRPADGELPSNVRLEVGDICDAARVLQVLRAHRPHTVVHLAAETHVDASFGNSYAFTRTNVLGTHTLLECCREYVAGGGELRRFLHMSTDEVYGAVSDGQQSHEGSLLAPSNPYAASKAAAEMLCHAYLKSFRLPVVVLRCNNAISLWQHEEKLVPRAIADISEGRPVPVHGDGSSRRTFVYGDDIAVAILAVMSRGQVGAVYNIGSEEELSVLEVIAAVLRRLRGGGERLQGWVRHVPDRPFQDTRYSVDTTALRALGWAPQVGFHEALGRVVDAWRGRSTAAS